MDQYNGVDGGHGFYGFDNIEVVSAGERDPDAEGVEGMSASKMRGTATDGDLRSFKQGVPSGFKDVEKLYRDVRKVWAFVKKKIWVRWIPMKKCVMHISQERYGMWVRL